MSATTKKVLMFGTWLFNIGPFAKAPWSWDDVLDLAVKLGFGGVAPGGFGKHLSLDRLDTPEKIAKVNEQMQRLGLILGTLAADIWGPTKKWLTDEGRTAYVAAAKAFIDLAAALGIKAIRIDPNYAHWEVAEADRKSAFIRFVDILKEIASYGEEKGVTVQIEPEPPWLFLTTVQGICDLIDAVDHAFLKAMYDYCHMNRIIQDPSDHYDDHIAAIDKMGDRIGSLHISDNCGGELVHEPDFDHPPTARHRPLGDGDIDLAAVSRRLEQIPAIAASSERTLDLCFYQGKYPDVLEQSLTAMQAIWN